MNIKDYIESGILETYVLGLAGKAECEEVERMAAAHPEVKKEIAAIAGALEKYSVENSIPPHPAVKPMLMATVDYIKRLENGELPASPPVLNENSSPADYKEWLEREDMKAPADFENIYARIIGYTPEATSAIVWLKSMAPEEVHDNEHEKFLVIEGTCDITIGTAVHSLVPGDYLAIPLHVGHKVKVTSSHPCKVILQRIAA